MCAAPIYHIGPREDWEAAKAAGHYEGSPQDRADGFIHFSTAEQVEDSAAKHRTGQPGLVLLAVDPEALGDSLRWEASRGGALFPHLYGVLPLAALRDVWELPLGPDSRHLFPAPVLEAAVLEDGVPE
jgi:uncharacterized protein (DUF952 family)